MVSVPLILAINVGVCRRMDFSFLSFIEWVHPHGAVSNARTVNP